MYICTAPFRRTILATLLAISLMLDAPPSLAEVLLSFDFDDGLGGFENTADYALPQLAVGSWTDLDGTLTNFSGNPGKALAARSFDDGNTLEFTFELARGFVLDIDGYAFDQRASSQGPAIWVLAIDSTTVGSGDTSLDFAPVAGQHPMTGLSGVITVGITGTGGATNSGTLRIDNFSLSGEITAVPFPSSLLLLGSTGVLFSVRARRKI
jgi:hypothetical protein